MEKQERRLIRKMKGDLLEKGLIGWLGEIFGQQEEVRSRSGAALIEDNGFLSQLLLSEAE